MPETESQGRIHTSTATVAVLPEAEEVEVEVDPNDLQIDVYRSSGPGGQSVNTTDSAVRITHKPTGIVVSMQDEKSQLQNKDRAMRVLRARLLERELAEQQAKIASERKAQVGSGERSEKVRTYNFPQGRVTDHRIKLTSHNLDGVLGGELSEFTDALAAEEKRRRLEAAAAAPERVAGSDAGAACREALRRGRRCAARPRASRAAPRRRSAARRGERVGPGAARRRSRRRGRRPPRRGASGRWCGGGCGASRSPTSSAARGFRQIELAVDRRVLIPRPETELLVELALELRAGDGARRRHRLGGDRPRGRRRAARLRGDRDRYLAGARWRSRAPTPSASGSRERVRFSRRLACPSGRDASS